jgi:hypothetical protein
MTMLLKFLISLWSVAGFGIVLWRSGLADAARGSVQEAMNGLAAVLDHELEDDSREPAVRRAGLSVVASAGKIAWWFGLALLAAGIPIFGADLIGLVPRDAVFDLMLRPDYIVVVSIIAFAVARVLKLKMFEKARQPPQTTRYSKTDQFFHMLAFSRPVVLKAAAWCEDRFYAQHLDELPDAIPIFVTSLARGGTTALLNALHDIPGIATHRYRDMPFITAPLLWDKVSGGRRRAVGKWQRAHGDGLEIDLNSPEAFDEVIWRIFWPEKYNDSVITLWDEQDRKSDGEEFFLRHTRRVIIARRRDKRTADAGIWRYCSKNNANISRLRLLPLIFPHCQIVIPVRRPAAHASSLMRQHENFSKLQAEDEFLKRYMRDIGHLEFGLLHQPILFPDFEPQRYDVNSADYWLSYWIGAFSEVLRQGPGLRIVTQDDLRQRPQESMKALIGSLGVRADTVDFHGYFRSDPDRTRESIYTPSLLEKANSIYEALESRAIRS